MSQGSAGGMPVTWGAAIGLVVVAFVATRQPNYTGPQMPAVGGGARPAVVATSVAPAAPQGGEDGDKGDAILG